MGLQIFGNLDRNTVTSGLVLSATNLNQKAAPNLVAGDIVEVDIFLTSNNGPVDIQSYSNQRLGIGSINAKPSGGTFKIDYGGTSNEILNFNATASDIASAIESNAPSVPTPVTGTQIAPFTYVINFGSNGTCDLPTVDATGLTPSSSVSVQRLITGNSTTKEQWLVRLFQNPIAFVESDFVNITDANSHKGIRGSLKLGTEGVYDLLDENSSVDSTIELELTDSSGNVQTIFQVPITILADVIGLGSTAFGILPSSLSAEARAFIDSFPNPTFTGAVTFDGSTSGYASPLTVTGNAVVSEVLQVGNVATSGTGNIIASGQIIATTQVTAPDRLVTREIKNVNTSSEGQLPINYKSNEHTFQDYDGTPDNLMVIKKIDGYTGARIGINKDPSAANDVTLHVVAGKNNSTGVEDLALKVIGGAFFEEYVRIGHYATAPVDADGVPTLPVGSIIFNTTSDKFQGNVGSANGGWKTFQFE